MNVHKDFLIIIYYEVISKSLKELNCSKSGPSVTQPTKKANKNVAACFRTNATKGRRNFFVSQTMTWRLEQKTTKTRRVALDTRKFLEL